MKTFILLMTIIFATSATAGGQESERLTETAVPTPKVQAEAAPSTPATPAAKILKSFRQVTPVDVAAVRVYHESLSAMHKEVKALRADVRKETKALAKALMKMKDFSEEEVLSIHKDLTVAKQKLAMAELNHLLFYKKYNPNWQPNPQDKAITVPPHDNASSPNITEGN